MKWSLIPETFGLPLLIRTLNERWSRQPPQSAASSAPGSATASGVPGALAYTTDHLYVCVAPDTWKRATLSTF